MIARNITTASPVATTLGHARHRHLRVAVATAGVAALIAAGGYVATTTIGPDSVPTDAPSVAEVNPSAQALRELRETVAGQYGSQSASGAVVNPSAQALRELRETVAGQYGSQSAAGAVVSPSAQALRELHRSIAGQYGAAR